MAQIFNNTDEHGTDAECSDLYHHQLMLCSARETPKLSTNLANTILMLGYVTTALKLIGKENNKHNFFSLCEHILAHFIIRYSCLQKWFHSWASELNNFVDIAHIFVDIVHTTLMIKLKLCCQQKNHDH